MRLDPRGGHNRKQVNENFFKTWSAQMAYILGLVYSDGTIEDVRKSSRACYMQITSKNKKYLSLVKKTLKSNHAIYTRKPHRSFIQGKLVEGGKHYYLRIGNRVLYSDLVKIGLTPKKSLTMKLPRIPNKYLNFFLRGYFDGDGSICVYKPKGRQAVQLSLVFTGGSMVFLTQLAETIKRKFKYNNQKRIYRNSGAYTLKYSKKQSLKLLSFMYEGLNSAPFLEKKYQIFQKFS